MSKSCQNPVLAYCIGINSDTGKKIVKFKIHADDNIKKLTSKYGEDNVFTLPCGRCESCRSNYAEEWSVRCQLESFYHQYNYFVTLTYDDVHLPYASYKDFRRFIDRLEGHGHKNKVAFLACEEHGELNGRYHLHAILFMDKELTLCDEVLLGKFRHYHSKELSDAWTYGLHDVSLFDLNCGRYVAKYTTKSQDGFHGSIHMTRNLGKRYFEEHFNQIISDNFKIYLKTNNIKKFYIDIPKSMISWFRDLGCVEVEDFVYFKKQIGHLSNISKTQLVGGSNVEAGISYASLLSTEKHKERRK